MAKNDTHNVTLDAQAFRKAKKEDGDATKYLNRFRGTGSSETGVLMGSGDPMDLESFIMSFNAMLSTCKYPGKLSITTGNVAEHTAPPAAPKAGKAK